MAPKESFNVDFRVVFNKMKSLAPLGTFYLSDARVPRVDRVSYNVSFILLRYILRVSVCCASIIHRPITDWLFRSLSRERGNLPGFDLSGLDIVPL